MAARQALDALVAGLHPEVTRRLDALTPLDKDDVHRIDHNRHVNRFYYSQSYSTKNNPLIKYICGLLINRVSPPSSSPDHSDDDVVFNTLLDVRHVRAIYLEVGPVPLYNVAVVAYHRQGSHRNALATAKRIVDFLYDHVEALDEWIAILTCFLLIDVHLCFARDVHATVTSSRSSFLMSVLAYANKLLTAFLPNSSSNNNSTQSKQQQELQNDDNDNNAKNDNHNDMKNVAASQSNEVPSGDDNNYNDPALPLLSPCHWIGSSTTLIPFPPTYAAAKFCIHIYNGRLAHAIVASSSPSPHLQDLSIAQLRQTRHALVMALKQPLSRSKPMAAALLLKAHIDQFNPVKCLHALSTIVSQCPDAASVRKARPLALNALGILHHRFGRQALATCYFEQARKAFDDVYLDVNNNEDSDTLLATSGLAAIDLKSNEINDHGNGNSNGDSSCDDHGDGDGNVKSNRDDAKSDTNILHDSYTNDTNNENNETINSNISIRSNMNNNADEAGAPVLEGQQLQEMTHLFNQHVAKGMTHTKINASTQYPPEKLPSSSRHPNEHAMTIMNLVRDSHVTYNLALQYMTTGQFSRALDCFSVCARSDPALAARSALLWIRMAECCVSMQHNAGGPSLAVEGRGRSRRMIMRVGARPDLPAMEYAVCCAQAALNILDDKQTRASKARGAEDDEVNSNRKKKDSMPSSSSLQQQQQQLLQGGRHGKFGSGGRKTSRLDQYQLQQLSSSSNQLPNHSNNANINVNHAQQEQSNTASESQNQTPGDEGDSPTAGAGAGAQQKQQLSYLNQPLDIIITDDVDHNPDDNGLANDLSNTDIMLNMSHGMNRNSSTANSTVNHANVTPQVNWSTVSSSSSMSSAAYMATPTSASKSSSTALTSADSANSTASAAGSASATSTAPSNRPASNVHDDTELRGAAWTLIAYASLSFDAMAVVRACDRLDTLYARMPEHERWKLAQLYAAEALCMLNRPKQAVQRLSPLLNGSFHLDAHVREAAYVNMALTHVCANDMVNADRAARVALKMYTSAESPTHRDIRKQAVIVSSYIFLRNGDTEAAREVLRLLHHHQHNVHVHADVNNNDDESL